MGFCPIDFSVTRPFISARLLYAPDRRQWVHLGTPTTQFPPKGTFYVPRELFPESFQGSDGNVAAWVLEDQPDWEGRIGAKYRANSLEQPPAEIITVDISSSDVEAIRKLLLNDGIAFQAGLTERPILIEFADGVVAGPFNLASHDSSRGRYVCNSAALLNPVNTWPAHGKDAASRLVITWCDQQRVFATDDPLPPPQGGLFLAPLDELLRRANLAGGVASQHRIIPADLNKHIAAIQQSLERLPASQVSEAIVQRLQPLVDRAVLDHSAKMALDEYLAKHPLFEQAVQKLADDRVATLRDDIRAEVLQQETQIQERIIKLTQRFEDDKQRLAQELLHEENEAARLRQQSQLQMARLQKEQTELEASVADLNLKARTSLKWTASVAQAVKVIESPNQAVGHLEKNLCRMGLLTPSAQKMAREVFVAACLGQMVMFRGSFALPLARAVAHSFAGNCIHWLSVPVGIVTALPPLPQGPPDGVSALLIEGINRSCFESYAGELAVILEERCLGLRSPPIPVVIGTLLDSPSSVPPSHTLLSCGPVFSGDDLSWKANIRAQSSDLGRCVASAWKLEPRSFGIKNLIPDKAAMPIRWRQNIVAAAALLAALGSPANKDTDGDVDASLLYGWIRPFLMNGEKSHCEIPKDCEDRWQAAAQKDPQRLGRLLCFDSSKEKS
jgi:hypothetical protein